MGLFDKGYDFAIPITSGCYDGNGVVVGDLLITAGHVVNKDDTIHITIKGDAYSLNRNDAIVCLEEKSMFIKSKRWRGAA